LDNEKAFDLNYKFWRGVEIKERYLIGPNPPVTDPFPLLTELTGDWSRMRLPWSWSHLMIVLTPQMSSPPVVAG
jgi:hypothetical protein